MHQDMQLLIDFINSGGKFNNHYEGEEAIFSFLYQLNDLVRLTKEIELAQYAADQKDILTFPFDKYKDFNNLPRIDVEFDLANDFETQGRFMLLDTAGPNEAGQDELKVALTEQLERSSAVMIVLDYTQLNSEAEKDVKDQIDKIPTVQKSRLFALVNKFDQKSANADEADATRTHIYHNLLKEKIELENVYAISAQDSYLAKRMANYLAVNNMLPELKPKTWVEDFAKKIYGEMAEDIYPTMNPEQIQKGLNKIIARSRMQEPMQNVIVNMQRNAPIIAMQSALIGASAVFDRLHNTLDIRAYFASKERLSEQEIEKFNTTIAELEKQIEQLDDRKKKLEEKINEIIQDIAREIYIEDKVRRIEDESKKEIKSLFYKEAQQAKEDKLEADNTQRHLWPGSFFRDLFPTKTVKIGREELAKLHERAKSTGDQLIFSEEEDLKNFEQEVGFLVNQFANQYIVEAFDKMLEESVAAVKNTTQEINEESKKLLAELKNDFTDKGIDLRINFDGIGNINKQAAKLKHLSLNATHKTETKTYNESGFMGRIKRGFGGFFGRKWGTSTYTFKTYTINRQETIDTLMRALQEDFIAPLRDQVDLKIKKLLEESTNYIDEFGKKVEEIVNETKNNINNDRIRAHQSISEQEAYKQKIRALSEQHAELKQDWDKVAEVFSVEAIQSKSQ
ncbi:hypothetical protein [Moraxella atlantae]|uniref:Dynamin family protein n=1 Tax=Faucicola atlantae TaxID=34059 RepID=A0A378Q1Q4_9GAMM|nr:hypothetical protein [Moraxella atlantae]OPH34074.1 hypothetical protein B5J92_08470 [Moraxella atlantae]STY94456.1 Uncharacterised protein [Moraxella atlantae]